MSEEPASLPAPALVGKRKPWRKPLIISAITLVNVGLLILLVSQLLTPASQPGTHGLIGNAAPTFSLTLLSAQENNKILSLADFRGKPMVINFWASWCDPCKEEAALLENTWKQMQVEGKDVVFLGIDFQETRGEALSFLQAYNITYPLMLDTHGTVANQYYIASLPDTIFIDRHGTVVSKVAQQITTQLLTQNLQLIV